MPSFTPLLQATFAWEDDYGVEGFPDVHLARLEAVGLKVSVIRGEKGSMMPPHSHSVGAMMFVVEGRVLVDGVEYGPGDAGIWSPQVLDQFHVEFLTDGSYLTIRRAEDEMRSWDMI